MAKCATGYAANGCWLCPVGWDVWLQALRRGGAPYVPTALPKPECGKRARAIRMFRWVQRALAYPHEGTLMPACECRPAILLRSCP